MNEAKELRAYSPDQIQRFKRIHARVESRADRIEQREEHRRESGRKLHALKGGKGRL